jgi:hypothetical protein
MGKKDMSQGSNLSTLMDAAKALLSGPESICNLPAENAYTIFYASVPWYKKPGVPFPPPPELLKNLTSMLRDEGFNLGCNILRDNTIAQDKEQLVTYLSYQFVKAFLDSYPGKLNDTRCHFQSEWNKFELNNKKAEEARGGRRTTRVKRKNRKITRKHKRLRK